MTANVKDASGSVTVQVPAGWRVAPEAQEFHFAQPGEEATLRFEVTPPQTSAKGEAEATAKIGNRWIHVGMSVID
ncbi:MAG TPA: NEW3 domain-containing protein, partial [Bryobacteraceae bacterium]|nr:NEW3 domain-containing protein [Bryobacteraceae bacterium]